MNKKGIFATILVIQLIFLVVLTIFVVQNEKVQFEYDKEYRRVASYRIAAIYDDVIEGLDYLHDKNANSQTIDSYINFINTDFAEYYLIDIEFNESYIKIADDNLEIVKEVWLP
jgi:hypothetical protein